MTRAVPALLCALLCAPRLVYAQAAEPAALQRLLGLESAADFLMWGERWSAPEAMVSVHASRKWTSRVVEASTGDITRSFGSASRCSPCSTCAV